MNYSQPFAKVASLVLLVSLWTSCCKDPPVQRPTPKPLARCLLLPPPASPAIQRDRVEACLQGGWEACYDAETAWTLGEYLRGLIDYANDAWTLCGDKTDAPNP